MSAKHHRSDGDNHQKIRFLQASQATSKITASNSKTFFFATQLLPKVKRDAVRALYAFCRTTDDLVDCHGADLERMENWRKEVHLKSTEQTNDLLFAWAMTREGYQIKTQYQDELIEGISWDILNKHYTTWEELQEYCYRVASTVGLLSIPIIGLRDGISFDQASPYAIQLGIALQLTNILRDVGEDASKGRVYLPEEDLIRFGLTYHDILNAVQDARFTQLMQFEIHRAQALYAEAIHGIALLHPSARPAVGAAALLYRAILDEIVAIQYKVYIKRARTSFWKKIRMLPGILQTISRLDVPTRHEIQQQAG